MSHKDAPPITPDQARFEAWWIARRGPGYTGFGRDKDGNYFSEFTRDAWAAWQFAQRTPPVPPPTQYVEQCPSGWEFEADECPVCSGDHCVACPSAMFRTGPCEHDIVERHGD